MNIISIPSTKLREEIAVIKEKVLLENQVFEITENGRSTGVIIAPKKLGLFEKSKKKSSPDFRKLARTTKKIFSDQFPGKTSEEIARTLRETSYRY